MFKVGDRVKVVRSISKQEGWKNSWTQGMDSYIGKTYTVLNINEYGYKLGDSYRFPSLSLELVASHRPHADVIKAWVDGARIQFRIPKAGNLDHDWKDIPDNEQPAWYFWLEYRIKPEPKPDIVKQFYFHNGASWYTESTLQSNVECVFDGETGKLKAVKLI